MTLAASALLGLRKHSLRAADKSTIVDSSSASPEIEMTYFIMSLTSRGKTLFLFIRANIQFVHVLFRESIWKAEVWLIRQVTQQHSLWIAAHVSCIDSKSSCYPDILLMYFQHCDIKLRSCHSKTHTRAQNLLHIHPHDKIFIRNHSHTYMQTCKQLTIRLIKPVKGPCAMPAVF